MTGKSRASTASTVSRPEARNVIDALGDDDAADEERDAVADNGDDRYSGIAQRVPDRELT